MTAEEHPSLARRSTLIAGGAAAISSVSARIEARENNKGADVMTDMTDTITAILTDYVDRWNEYDADGMVSYWDQEDDNLIYVAEELDALRGWKALEGYFRGSDPETTAHLITFRDVTARLIAPDVIQAFWHMNWNVFFTTERLYQKPIGGEVRATALLRKKGDDWKFFHWIESPLASLIQLKRAHEANVDPRLFDIIKDKGWSVP